MRPVLALACFVVFGGLLIGGIVWASTTDVDEPSPLALDACWAQLWVADRPPKDVMWLCTNTVAVTDGRCVVVLAGLDASLRRRFQTTYSGDINRECPNGVVFRDG